jgi:S-methylmethionine-dependent homocysteine/selenocysteine methylase
MIWLDGPMGSRLEEQGIDVSAPAWSARALRSSPQAVAALHREYAAAGAQVHRANTFRTTKRAGGDDWETLARLAVKLAREASGGGRVAGSVGPLEDCYRPELSPPHSRDEHAQLVRVLVDAGVDLLMCEAFSNPREAVEAVEACAATGLETWVSFTAGPDGTLLTPRQVYDASAACVSAGAKATLINCVAAELTLPYVQALTGPRIGAYANAGVWNGPKCTPERYAQLAGEWRDAGATVLGCCCGTSTAHLKALRTE